MLRRTFLAAAGSAALPALPAASAPAASAGLVDTNVSLFDWVVRRSWADSPARLVEKLRRHGVTAAWTGSHEGVLHTDLAGVNARLADACRQHGAGVLVPFGSVNPTFPDWEDDLRRCHEVHRMPGIRLHPNYHGYTLDDARFARLLQRATDRGLRVQIAVSIEDERSQNPILAALPVAPGPMLDLLPKIPGARVMLLNATSRVFGQAALLQKLAAARVLLELATLEGAAGIATVLQRAPQLPLTFGSHAPYFYFEAALLKLQESPLDAASLAAIRHGHAHAFLSRA
jgi:hypothetical protein